MRCREGAERARRRAASAPEIETAALVADSAQRCAGQFAPHRADSDRTHMDDARLDAEPILSYVIAAVTSSKHEMLARIDEAAVVQSAQGDAIEGLDRRTAVLETAMTAIKHQTDGLAKRIEVLEARPATPPTQSPAPRPASSFQRHRRPLLPRQTHRAGQPPLQEGHDPAGPRARHQNVVG